MSTKGSHEWYKQVGKQWDHYVGDHATVCAYAEGGQPYVTRLQQDLKKWWGDHPNPAKRLSPDKIDAVAHRLADLVKMYTSDMTPLETLEQFQSVWMTFSENKIPEDLPRRTPIHKRSAMSTNENEKNQNLDS
jgi:hypothetical protein